ncbi:alpha/beta fold hydrolase [[Mycoplasma] mobile]|nr:alpha/beta fold hydrolase [[Mycoplasma] mobile]
MEKSKIQILGETISYIFEDTGRQKVLFIHGFNSSTSFANNIIYSKTRSFDVVAFDFPGSGGSTNNNEINISLFQKITKEFINKLNMKQIIIVSHSLGSVSALFVNNHPEVKYTILLSPYNYVSVSEIFNRTLFTWLLPKTKEEAISSLESLVHQSPTESYKSNLFKQASSFLNNVSQKQNIFKNMVLNEIINLDFQNLVVKKLYFSAKKFSIISGYDDKFIPFTNLEKIQRDLGVDLIKIENCGHAIIFEKGKMIEDKIQEILNEIK